MKTFRIIVHGKVQGVFFRASAKEKADLLAIKGFAQNQPDGSVSIEATGSEDNLNQFMMWCKQGPPRAHVTRVDVQEAEPTDINSFSIRR